MVNSPPSGSRADGALRSLAALPGRLHRPLLRPTRPLMVVLLLLVAGVSLPTAAIIGITTYAGVLKESQRITALTMRSIAHLAAEKTQSYLQRAQPTLELNRQLLRFDSTYGAIEGQNVRGHRPSSEEWRERARLFARVLRANPGFYMVHFGDRYGDFTGAYYDPTGRLRVDHRWLDGSVSHRLVYEVDEDEHWTLIHHPEVDMGGFDPRTRPWYILASRSTNLVWTQPYLFASTGGPGVTAALRLLADDGSVAGVLGIDFELGELSRYVHGMDGGKTFLLTGDGRQVMEARAAAAPGPGREPAPGGESTSSPGHDHLPLATESADPVLRAAALRNSAMRAARRTSEAWPRALLREGLVHGRLPQLTEPSPSSTSVSPNSTAAAPAVDNTILRFRSEGKEYLGAYSTFETGRDAIWTAVVAVPEESIEGPLRRESYRTLGWCLGVLALALVVGALLSARISRPLRAFARELEQVERLVIPSVPSPPSSIEEVETITEALDRVKASLRSFQKYVPADLVRTLLETGREARLGGQTATLTVFFADVVGFSAIAERMAPADLVDALADYLEEIEEIISHHGGVVDKYIGDAVMAFWGAPIRPESEPEKRACAAALEYVERFETLRKHWAMEGRLLLEAHIGIHTGEAIVGNIGSQRRMNYTAMGDTVNVASHLEHLNRTYHTRILVSETTYAAVKDDFEFRPVDSVVVKGRLTTTMVYELIGWKTAPG